MAESEELLTVAEIAAALKMNQRTIRKLDRQRIPTGDPHRRRVRVKQSDFDALLAANYTGNKQPPTGVWGGDVPAPVAPGENVEHEATPPDAPSDAGEA